MRALIIYLTVAFAVLDYGIAIRCYQCSSHNDPEDRDLCGAFDSFDETRHTPVDCLQEQAHTPGIFCLKEVKQGPRMFIWDKRWRTVIRRCASVSETGATNVCNWGVDENNVFWEQCYCTSDNCNSSSTTRLALLLLFLAPILCYLK